MPICMVVGNWKMNKSVAEAQTLAAEIVDKVSGVNPYGQARVVVCPPFVALTTAQAALKGSLLSLGAQNLHHKADGAFTGEVSASMLAKICRYVIVGHSERRSLFGETDADVNLKLKAALDARLKPIVCVGEDSEQRSAGDAESVVEAQVRAALDDVEFSVNVVVAYEPVWAIGTGQSATPDAAQAMMARIRETLASIYGAYPATLVPLLYGGSVNAANTAEYIRQADVDGVLVGSASLDAKAFADIVAAVVADG